MKLKIHSKLRKILFRIQDQSKIARYLLRTIPEDKLVEEPVNYINISSDLTKLSYLTLSKYKKFIKNNREFSSNDLFYTKGRVKIRYGAFVKKVLKDMPPKDIENFASLLKSEINKPPYRFKIVSGRIGNLFHWSKNKSDSGQLGISCMRHDRCQNYFEFYDVNNEIQLLTMQDSSNKVVGRALLWNLDEKNGLEEEFKFMDRIYCIKDEYMHYFINWANSNGYYYKEKQSWSRPYHFIYKGKVVEKKLKIKLKADFEKYPYLDTFKWLNTKDYTLMNHLPESELDIEDKKNLKTVVSTYGQLYSWGYMREDEHHKEYAYEKDLAWVDYKKCWIKKDYLNYSRFNDEFILSEDALYDELLDDFIFNEKMDEYNNSKLEKIREQIREQQREERRKLEKMVKNSIPLFMEYIEETKNELFDTDPSFDEYNFVCRKVKKSKKKTDQKYPSSEEKKWFSSKSSSSFGKWKT